MGATPAEVVSSTPTDADELARVPSFIEAHEARHGTSPEPAFFLTGAREHDRVELEQLHATEDSRDASSIGLERHGHPRIRQHMVRHTHYVVR